MKKLFIFFVLIAFCGLNVAIGQWNTNGDHIYNTNSGNVGIGNGTPSTLLHVAKSMTEPTITVQNLGSNGGATYMMIDNMSGANWKFKATTLGGFKIRDHANLLDVIVIEPNSSANAIYIKGGGNVGIGTPTPHNSALVEMSSTNKGFLPPRVALTAINSATPITSPAIGLMVYNTVNAGTPPNNVITGYYYWNGTRWISGAPPQGTNAGDMLYWNGTQWMRVPVGTNGQSLVLVSAVPTWSNTASVSAPTVITNDVTNVSSVSAVGGGNVSDGGSPVTARGVCWSLSLNPTIADPKTTDGVGSGSFISNITNLSPNLTYHVRAYATNSINTSYGADKTFTTINITTAAVTNIMPTTATSGGTITSDGGNPITARGVCWNIYTSPNIGHYKTIDGSGTGTFTSNLTALTGNTLYYVRAYLTNTSGTFYGNEVVFTTAPIIPILSTTDTSYVTQTTAISGGNITNDGGCSIVARGVCWNTSPNPTTANPKTNDGSGSGPFTSYITGLLQNTTYYVRAYAINCAGTGYGNNISFKTDGTLPTVTTDEISSITATTAHAYGTVTYAGNPSATSRGFCWRTSPNPTINHNKVVIGSGAGEFNGTLTLLATNTTYHVRAFATNTMGTVYGEDSTFTTSASYYEGFENGFPSTWSGIGWGIVSDNPYELDNCLFATQVNDSITFTRTVTTSPNGAISFYYLAPINWSNYASTRFYIDDVLKATISEGSWTLHSYTCTAGTHTFKWKVISEPGGGAYIDYIIVSP